MLDIGEDNKTTEQPAASQGLNMAFNANPSPVQSSGLVDYFSMPGTTSSQSQYGILR